MVVNFEKLITKRKKAVDRNTFTTYDQDGRELYLYGDSDINKFNAVEFVDTEKKLRPLTVQILNTSLFKLTLATDNGDLLSAAGVYLSKFESESAFEDFIQAVRDFKSGKSNVNKFTFPSGTISALDFFFELVAVGCFYLTGKAKNDLCDSCRFKYCRRRKLKN